MFEFWSKKAELIMRTNGNNSQLRLRTELWESKSQLRKNHDFKIKKDT